MKTFAQNKPVLLFLLEMVHSGLLERCRNAEIWFTPRRPRPVGIRAA
jgi:hypothetical protein